ncbi:MAG: ORF6N domain-containing protein [Chitinophagales bacterium]|nr:ORF6N domain-containing protein [Chitinophagales bacterium]
MMEEKSMIPDEVVLSKIYFIRGQKVMFDRDLAKLYDVETKRLKEQVRRNIFRFPADFMFELTKEELANWRSQFATSNKEIMGLRRPPFAFTEYGIIMLSSVLNSDRAVKMNIQIIRVFVKLRKTLLTHKDLLLKIEQIEKAISSHDHQLVTLFELIKKLLSENEIRATKEGRNRIGFKKGN